MSTLTSVPEFLIAEKISPGEGVNPPTSSAEQSSIRWAPASAAAWADCMFTAHISKVKAMEINVIM